MNQFVNLHGHSEYSSLDGFCQISKLVSQVKSIEQSAVALTDHGNLNGAYKFYSECIKQEVKPILGNEMYLIDKYETKSSKLHHVTLLAKNNTGWSNLLQLHKISFQNFYYKPRVSFSDLIKHKEGIIMLSGCPAGVLSMFVWKDEIDIAIKNLKLFHLEFKEDFYIEIMNHGLDFQHKINSYLRQFSVDYNIKKVATNDFHYPAKEDALYQDYLICDQLKTTLDDPQREIKMEVDEFYIKRREEIDALSDELDVSLEIADKCNVEIKSKGWLLPQVDNSEGKLLELIDLGIKRRKMLRTDIYMKRLREEYSVITEANLVGYFLIVQDYIQYARANGILVGPGRGSVGGCLIGYLLGIHDIDPIKHKLLFSRFYNAGRTASLPDIDTDFPENEIEKVREYVKKRYGQEKVSHIGTSTVLQLKGAMKLVCRVLGIDFQLSNKYSDIIEDPKLRDKEKRSNPEFKDLSDKADHFDGLSAYSSIHAAGMVISPVNLDTLIPLRLNEDNGIYVSGWDMKDVESVGLVKFDFLSLNTLDVISDTLKSINLRIEDIPTEDKDAFDLITNTTNVGIFQLSSDGISDIANRMGVQSIDDIAVVVALYRPGPIASNLHNEYIMRKNGETPISYKHPLLKKVLEDTYGIFVFQEQITQAAMILASFTEKEADNLRKAMGKKLPELMKEQKSLFIKGCEKNNIDEEIAVSLWDEIEEFSSYSFNRCISGDCFINRDNYNGTRYNIRDMYRIKNSNDKLTDKEDCLRYKYEHNGYGKARNLINGRSFLDNIKDIYYNGVNKCYKITLDNGDSIESTSNHKFPTNNGIKTLSEINLSEDLLYTLGDYEINRKSYRLSIGERDVHKQYEGKGFRNGEENPGYIDGSHVKYSQIIKDLSHIKNCQDCGKWHRRFEHHHKDGNRFNNIISNIEKLCPSCHKKKEYIIGRKKKHSKGRLTKLCKIVSIEYIGEKDTYDIEMQSEPHNLFVNNIAVCNSHSVSYGYITYYTAYLKVHYPKEFMCALLNNNYYKPEKLRLYLSECEDMGIKIDPPSIKRGDYNFVVNDDSIVFGLKGLNGIGEKTAKELYNVRCNTLEEFIKTRPSKDTLLSLAESGALDDFGYSRSQLINSVDYLIGTLKVKKQNKLSRRLFDNSDSISIPQSQDYPDHILASKEYNRLRVYLKYNPLKGKNLVSPEKLEGIIFIEGFLTKFETKVTKKKNTIGLGILSTNMGELDIILFPTVLMQNKDKIKEHVYVAIEGNYTDKLMVNKIWIKND